MSGTISLGMAFMTGTQAQHSSQAEEISGGSAVDPIHSSKGRMFPLLREAMGPPQRQDCHSFWLPLDLTPVGLECSTC